ncbi:APC family permease [Aminipila luticellarii]|uniref:Amino acid permease n=1 Tax=Aminipila luticellarii TaxID=2507160 RepID=A0A410PV30_9FIRM|nr:APC family permease [Aminipila luticellarii]QAT42774.1 amino acid permease [Aminipila luticellarii]
MESKKISLLSMIMFGICSLVVLYTWSASAARGTHGLGVWIIMAFAFLIPNCLTVSELGSTYVEDGGISLWVTKAFGPVPGSVVGWFYWVNYVFGLPLVFITIMGNLQAFFFPNLSSLAQMAGTIGLIWFTVIVGICNSGLTQKICAFGGNVVAGILAVIVALAVIFCIKNGGTATHFTLSGIIPSWSMFVDFAPVVVFNLLGFELISSVASQCDNPQKNVPKFTTITGIIVGLAYVMATVAIMAIIPESQVDSVNGIVDAVQIAAVSIGGEALGKVLTSLIVIAIVYGLAASGIAWAFGTSAVISSAGLGEKSAILGHKNKKYGTPDYAYLIMGIFGTAYTVLSFAGGDSINAIYDFIFCFSSMLFMTPYVFMYPSLIRLRKIDPDRERPYKVPGGNIGVWVCGLLPTISVIFAIVGLSLPAEGVANPGMQLLKSWGGFAVITLIGILLHYNGERKAKKAASESLSGGNI